MAHGTGEHEPIARLTWAGAADGLQPCPACHRALRVADAVSAQGTTTCAYGDCHAALYVRISYEWRDGRARLFADQFSLETVDALRARHLGPFECTWVGRHAGSWRSGVPAGAMVGAGVSVMGLCFSLWVPSLAPWVLWAAGSAAIVGFAVATVRLSRIDHQERIAVHERSRKWAERLLASPPGAVLEAAEATPSSATETDGTVTGAFRVETPVGLRAL